MKRNIFKFATLMLASALLFTSCEKTKVTTGDTYVTADISGAYSGSYQSDDKTSKGVMTDYSYQINSTKVSLTDIGAMQECIIFLGKQLNVGSYNLKNVNDNYTSFTFAVTGTGGSNARGWTVSSGNNDDFTFAITKKETNIIEGTFSGKMRNASDNTEITVTNGKFRGKF